MQMRLAWCCLGQCSSSAARFDLSDTPFFFFLVYKKASDLIAKTTPVYTNTVFPRQVWDYIYVLKSQAHLQKLQDRHGASASLTSSCRTKSSVPCPFPTSKPLRTKAALPHRSPAAPFGVEFTQDQSPALTLSPCLPAAEILHCHRGVVFHHVETGTGGKRMKISLSRTSNS